MEFDIDRKFLEQGTTFLRNHEDDLAIEHLRLGKANTMDELLHDELNSMLYGDNDG